MISELTRAERAIFTTVAALLAAALGWRIVADGVQAQRGGADPLELAADPSTGPAAPTESVWRRRLAANPTDFAALLSLAVELEGAGKPDEAQAALDQVLKLAPTNAAALTVAASFALRRGDEEAAIRHLDRFVTLHPQEASKAWPVMTAALASGRHRDYFEGVARANPPWWPTFFRIACDSATDFGAAQRIFALRVRAGLATEDERRCAIDRLQRQGLWPVAYQHWLNGLPADQRRRVGFVYNGGFEQPLSNLGFDWIVSTQDGVSTVADSTEGVTDRRALHVTFVNKRYAGPPLHQFLMLYPGRYRLEGRHRIDGLNVWLGLQWGLYCRSAAGAEERQLAHTETFSGSSDWTGFRQDFVVPRDCPVQTLRLELANPRQDVKAGGNVAIRLRGGIWFDDLRVSLVD